MTFDQFLLAIAASIPSLIIGWFGLRQSWKVDNRAGVVADNTFKLETTTQIINGLNTLVDQLQQEVERLKQEVGRLKTNNQELSEAAAKLINRNAMLSNGREK